MTTGHFVARLQTTLNGQIDFDHFLHTRWQLIALGKFLALFFEGQIKLVTFFSDRFLDRFQCTCGIFVSRTDVKPMIFLEIVQVGLIDLRTLGQLLRAAIGDFTDQHFFQTLEGIAFNDTQLVIQIQAITLEFIVNDLLRTLVTLNTFTREDLHVDDRTDHARRHPQRRVFNVRGFFAEDRAQQFFFWCELCLTLRCDLTDQHVTRFDFCADVHDTGLVQTRELVFSQV